MSFAPRLSSHSPIDGTLLGTVEAVHPDAVQSLVDRARSAQHAWGKLSLRERSAQIRSLGATVAREGEALAKLVTAETGKPLSESVWQEVFPIADLAHYFAGSLRRALSPRRIPLHLLVHRRSQVHYVPRGVVGVISPWNFPLSLGFGDVVMALAAGNAVVFKPSEETPLVGAKVREIVALAGLDPELVQIASGAGDVGQALVESDVDMIHFTGSVPTGRKVAIACAERFRPCVLELGGNDAAIVRDDANLDLTARLLVQGAFGNAGQLCASIERVYVMRSVFDALKERVVRLTKALRQGDARNEDVDLGPAIRREQLEVVRAQIDEAHQRGARALTGGSIQDERYYAPTVLVDLDEEMEVMRDETFGPIMPLVPVDSDEEAVARVNASRHGLNAYIYSSNAREARRLARSLRVGTVMINDVWINHAMPETPWGGVKESGIGHTHAIEGLRHLCEVRHINEPRLPSFWMPWNMPYRDETARGALQFARGWFGQGPMLFRLQQLLLGSVAIVKRYFQR